MKKTGVAVNLKPALVCSLFLKSFKSLMLYLKLFASLEQAHGYAKTVLNLLLENINQSIRKHILMI